MVFLLLVALLVFPISSFAQTLLPLSAFAGDVDLTAIPTPTGTTYFSSNGSYVEVTGIPPGQQSYTAHDRAGHVTTGFIFSPFAPTHFEPALSVPEYRGPVYDQASGQYLPPSYLNVPIP